MGQSVRRFMALASVAALLFGGTLSAPVEPELSKQIEAAVQAAHSNYEITTPDNVKTLANELISALSAIPY